MIKSNCVHSCEGLISAWHTALPPLLARGRAPRARRELGPRLWDLVFNFVDPEPGFSGRLLIKVLVPGFHPGLPSSQTLLIPVGADLREVPLPLPGTTQGSCPSESQPAGGKPLASQMMLFRESPSFSLGGGEAPYRGQSECTDLVTLPRPCSPGRNE